jgi:hypothetical protein
MYKEGVCYFSSHEIIFAVRMFKIFNVNIYYQCVSGHRHLLKQVQDEIWIGRKEDIYGYWTILFSGNCDIIRPMNVKVDIEKLNSICRSSSWGKIILPFRIG